MALPLQVARLLEGAKEKAVYEAGNDFNRATQRTAEREAASGIRSSHAQGRAALACLVEAEKRLEEYAGQVKGTLAAAGHAPTDAEQRHLLEVHSNVANSLMAEVSRRGDLGNIANRGIVIPQLSQVILKVRKKCSTEFEIMLMESAKQNIPQGPGVSIVYNLNGANTRVNQGSVDVSNNTVSVNDSELFSRLQQALNRIGDETARLSLLKEAELLRNLPDKPSRLGGYARFVQLAANHVTILGYLLPALAQWAGH